uniref:GTP cyclohydrolase 1 feedback regulatory protein n=1 Tax=Globodera rostochiensis TaxID=31243 RepID=A0A914HE60_GLORO
MKANCLFFVNWPSEPKETFQLTRLHAARKLAFWTSLRTIKSEPAFPAQCLPNICSSPHKFVKVYRFGNTFPEFITEWPPRKVLDRLSELGFSICV